MRQKYTSNNGDHILTVEENNYVYYYDNGRDLKKFTFPLHNQFTPREILKIFTKHTNQTSNIHEFSEFLKRHKIELKQVG